MKFNAATLDALIVGLQQQIDRGVTAILHHPDFQALEARWAGLRLLVESVPGEFIDDDVEDQDRIVVSLWNVSKSELADSLRYSDSPRTSDLYREVYERAFNMAGGQPFGILIGDFEFSDHPTDVALLHDIGAVCESAFTIFVAAASPALFHLGNFQQLYALTRSELREQGETVLAALFRELAYVDWNSLRSAPRSRFIVLALPRFLVRQSYEASRFLGRRALLSEDESPLAYNEPRISSQQDHRLWANAAFAVGQVVLRSFANSGWLADIHGLSTERTRAGVLPLAVRDEQFLHEADVLPSIATEVVITDELEKELSALGFLCLCDRQPVPCAFLGSTPTIHLPAAADDAAGMISERLSSMLHYMLCACRFAHYIKRIGHDHVGTMGGFADYQRTLHDFLIQYVLQDENAAAELKARQPLNDANVKVSPVPGRKGEYHCEIMLKPHYELDAVEVRLETEIVGGQAS